MVTQKISRDRPNIKIAEICLMLEIFHKLSTLKIFLVRKSRWDLITHTIFTSVFQIELAYQQVKYSLKVTFCSSTQMAVSATYELAACFRRKCWWVLLLINLRCKKFVFEVIISEIITSHYGTSSIVVHPFLYINCKLYFFSCTYFSLLLFLHL